MQDGVGCQKQRLLTPSPELPVGVVGGHIREEMQESVGIFNLGSQSKISVAKLMCISEHSINYSFIAKSPYFVLQWTKSLLCLPKKYFWQEKPRESILQHWVSFCNGMSPICWHAAKCRGLVREVQWNVPSLSLLSTSHLPPSRLPSFREMVRILLKNNICGNSALFGNFPRTEMKDWVFFQSTGGYDQGHARLWESKLIIGKTMPRIISREWGGRSRTSGWQLLRMGGGAGLMGGGWTLGGGRDFSR